MILSTVTFSNSHTSLILMVVLKFNYNSHRKKFNRNERFEWIKNIFRLFWKSFVLTVLSNSSQPSLLLWFHFRISENLTQIQSRTKNRSRKWKIPTGYRDKNASYMHFVSTKQVTLRVYVECKLRHGIMQSVQTPGAKLIKTGCTWNC